MMIMPFEVSYEINFKICCGPTGSILEGYVNSKLDTRSSQRKAEHDKEA
jgi:hypothetical protein